MVGRPFGHYSIVLVPPIYFVLFLVVIMGRKTPSPLPLKWLHLFWVQFDGVTSALISLKLFGLACVVIIQNNFVFVAI